MLDVISRGDGICGSSGGGGDDDGGGDDGGDDGGGDDGGDDGGGDDSSGDMSEQTHYLQQADLSQKALLLLPWLS